MKLIEAMNTLNLLQSLSGKAYPVKLSYAIALNISRLSDAVGPAEKQRIQVIEKYAEKDENGEAIIKDGNFCVPDEARDEMTAEVEQLLSEDVEIKLHKVKGEYLESIEGDKYDPLTPGILVALRFMIED